jgi:hypothetical protein
MLPRPRTLPAGFIQPCLPMKAPKPPSGALWLHEIKHDGFRVIAHKDGARQNRFLDRAVVHVARAVEIDHVKVLKYRRREADLLVIWKSSIEETSVASALVS